MKLIYFIHDYIYEPFFNFVYSIKWKLLTFRLFNKISNKPQIIYISFINGGGLALHISDLLNNMNNYEMWLFRSKRWIWHVYKGNRSVFRYPENMNLLDVINFINPDIIHIHQLSETLWELPHVPWEKCIVTTHDVYYMCPKYFMTECMGTRFCHPSLCSKEWREKMHYILRTCKKVICPSTAMKDIILFYYPDIEEKIVIIEHGI
jgi:hypothetical protein